MPGILFVVATPIGNLEDVTLRALRVLREADLSAAEDTRRTARLLQHYSISTPTTSLHEHNERQKTEVLLRRLQAGARIALVTDAGTPAVSDPGAGLIAAAIASKIRVEPIPGPNAALAALVASGLPSDEFTFLGFPPSRANARRAWLRALAGEKRTLVFFEAPHRIIVTLEDARLILGNRPISIGRELTKIHEELVRGPISEVLSAIAFPRGEYTVVMSGESACPVDSQTLPSPAETRVEFCQITKNEGISRRLAVTRLARKYGVSARILYQQLEMAKN